ncbi:hypothetical protein PoB_002613300 [Plakobranchus ocellatus]|uniref:Uncharacterized protein n=1 Tax=Plakobranchus ocellatus TaxID=259542 RepID=A0AAV3ZYW5_9GAST|nr:hypothetical protein PoB_002613300 [Plakobranchus ocellatus]
MITYDLPVPRGTSRQRHVRSQGTIAGTREVDGSTVFASLSAQSEGVPRHLTTKLRSALVSFSGHITESLDSTESGHELIKEWSTYCFAQNIGYTGASRPTFFPGLLASQGHFNNLITKTMKCNPSGAAKIHGMHIANYG